jgi:uncharacterized protein (DUF885 family)
MEQVEVSLKALISTGDAAQSPFSRPFLRIPESIAPGDKARLQAQAKQAIDEVVNPAYQRFEKFFRTTYLMPMHMHKSEMDHRKDVEVAAEYKTEATQLREKAESHRKLTQLYKTRSPLKGGGQLCECLEALRAACEVL